MDAPTDSALTHFEMSFPTRQQALPSTTDGLISESHSRVFFDEVSGFALLCSVFLFHMAQYRPLVLPVVKVIGSDLPQLLAPVLG